MAGTANLRREALSLYRDILRVARAFTWEKEAGVPWRGVLEAGAREEFEKNREVSGRENVLKLIVNGREALFKTEEKFMKKAKELRSKKAPNENTKGHPN